MVLVHEPGHGDAELLGEGRPVRRRTEGDLAVDGKGGEFLPGRGRPGDQLAHLLDHAGSECQQPEGGKAVREPVRVRRHRGQRRRRNQVRRRRRPQDAFGHVAAPPLLDELDEPMPLERLEVVVHLLPRQAHLRGELRCGSGLGQLAQDPRPDRVQRRLRRGRILNHSDVQHASSLPADNFICQELFSRRRSSVGGGCGLASSPEASEVAGPFRRPGTGPANWSHGARAGGGRGSGAGRERRGP